MEDRLSLSHAAISSMPHSCFSSWLIHCALPYQSASLCSVLGPLLCWWTLLSVNCMIMRSCCMRTNSLCHGSLHHPDHLRKQNVGKWNEESKQNETNCKRGCFSDCEAKEAREGNRESQGSNWDREEGFLHEIQADQHAAGSWILIEKLLKGKEKNECPKNEKGKGIRSRKQRRKKAALQYKHQPCRAWKTWTPAEEHHTIKKVQDVRWSFDNEFQTALVEQRIEEKQARSAWKKMDQTNETLNKTSKTEAERTKKGIEGKRNQRNARQSWQKWMKSWQTRRRESNDGSSQGFSGLLVCLYFSVSSKNLTSSVEAKTVGFSFAVFFFYALPLLVFVCTLLFSFLCFLFDFSVFQSNSLGLEVQPWVSCVSRIVICFLKFCGKMARLMNHWLARTFKQLCKSVCFVLSPLPPPTSWFSWASFSTFLVGLFFPHFLSFSNPRQFCLVITDWAPCWCPCMLSIIATKHICALFAPAEIIIELFGLLWAWLLPFIHELLLFTHFT